MNWTCLLHNLDTILLSLVINVNVLRFFLNIEETSLLLYTIYIICIGALYVFNRHRLKYRIHNNTTIKSYCIFWGLILLYFLVTCCISTYDYAVFGKYSVAIVISVLCLSFDKAKIKNLFFIVIFINIIYTLSIITNIDRVYAYMSGSVNYLNMTLTLGLCLSLCLASVVLIILHKMQNKLVVSIILTVFFFIAILPFPARGVMLFPPFIAIVIALINGKKHKKTLLSIFFGLAIFIFVGAYFFIQNASEYALIHMTNLFESTEEESRVGLWKTAIDAILDNFWIFLGAGLNGFKSTMDFYPHNIFFHFLADTGFVGCLGFSVFVYYIIAEYIKKGRKICSNCSEEYHWCFIAFLYYLFTFCKSFSMYDACPLLIMMSLCLCFVVSNKTVIR